MTLESVVNWLMEYIIKYDIKRLVNVLADYFPNIVPTQLAFPNRKYITTYLILNHIIELRNKEVRQHVVIDKTLQKIEFWRRFRSLIRGIVTDTALPHADSFLSENMDSYETCISEIVSLEYTINSKDFQCYQVGEQLDEMFDKSLFFSQSTKEKMDNVEDIKTLSAFKIRNNLANDADIKILKVISCEFIDLLKLYIEREIWKNRPLELEKVIHNHDYFKGTTDPYIRVLLDNIENLEEEPEMWDWDRTAWRESMEEKIIDLIEDLSDELELESIPPCPSIVYIADKETKGIIAVKVKGDVDLSKYKKAKRNARNKFSVNDTIASGNQSTVDDIVPRHQSDRKSVV